MELLVVIGIIALLVSILLPSLNKARQAAYTVKCLSNLRQFAAAQAMYASQWKGWAVPDVQGNASETFAGTSTKSRAYWLNNNAFRKNLNIGEWTPGSNQKDRVPDGMVCPNATKAIEKANKVGPNWTFSYGYNLSSPNYTGGVVVILPDKNAADADITFRSCKINRVHQSAQKLMFADSMTPHLKRQNSDAYMKAPGYNDADDAATAGGNTLHYVCYRHSKRFDMVNVCFWDGHAETMPRSKVIAERYEDKSHTDAWITLWDLGR